MKKHPINSNHNENPEIRYIYWFAFYNEDSPSVRYRGKYPLEFFEENYGIKSKLIIPGYHPKKVLAFLQAYFSALLLPKKDAIIVIQRVHTRFIYSSLLKLLVRFRRKNTVYDLDDADYLYSKPNSIYFFAKNCFSVAAGSNAIANHLAQFNDNIVITTSPTPDLKIVKQERNKRFTIGWIGGFGGDHKKGLVETVFPAINMLPFKCTFVILGVTEPEDFEFIRTYFDKNPNVEVEIPEDINWKDETEIQKRIRLFDIGIATLVDNAIQRSKSGIKAKQYMNNGVPVLGTNLPENDWVIKNGVNGFFCTDTSEFKQKLTQFYEMDKEEYSRFSKNARESIRTFNHESYYESFVKVQRRNNQTYVQPSLP